MVKEDDKKNKDKKDAKPKIDFSSFSKKLANIEEERDVNQIALAITDVYSSHAKYDKGGVPHYKEEFTREEAEALGDKVYDALGFHLHRRYLNIDEKGYEKLKAIKDPDGKPYIDTIVEHHFEINRRGLKRHLGKKKTGNKITLGDLQELLNEPVQKHARKAAAGIVSKEHLTDPENREMVKGAIEGIIKEYNENPENYELDRMDSEMLINTYIGLAKRHYHKGAHPEKKASEKK